MAKERLDTLLVQRQFCPSRQQAQRLIRAGEVKVNQQIIDKPGTEIDIAAEIQVKEKPPYVSRGGEKLIKALQLFNIKIAGRTCLDGGISTGGFTDCLLQAGAKHIYGVDVGYGQVAWKLRNDPRLTLKERTNFRYLTPEQLYGQETPADFGVMDLSFISLMKVLEPLWNLLIPPREIVLLVKPQFEVGREKVGKKGVVRQPNDRAQAIFQVLQVAKNLGWNYGGTTWSPITGPAGNIEYLVWLKTNGEAQFPNLETLQAITESVIIK
jgi:23S rRNA (cytidine1920-2'-O)/16S rRNA (cytidine1409-2'-O)-methyltransferase